jgi:vacuolar-type H+-ATPase subunit I/STV1
MHSLKKSWDWCKENWKYIVTFGIPVLISFIISLIRKNDSLENQLEMKGKEQEIDDQVNDLGEKLRQDALDTREATIAKVLEKHEETLERIAQEEQDTIESITDAESATEAIKEKLEEPAWKKLTADDIKPPRFPDPMVANKNRLCPCGSGLKYRGCHSKDWSPK